MSVLEKARSQSQICKKELIKLVYGSEEDYEKCLETIKKFKEFNPPESAFKFYELSRLDQVKSGYEFAANMIKNKFYDNVSGVVPHESTYYVNFEFAGSVSHLMVRTIIDVLGNDAQRTKWLPLMDSARCIGAYAQTELGHGSDVQSLETEVVFNESTKDFTLNSPTTSSIKWWPGELGHLSNIAIVYAKTIVKGRKLGVYAYLVQIRDFETHKPLDGVEVGDIGPKLGYGAKENGFLKFTNVRIPLNSILSRFTEITDTGDFLQKGNPKVVYSAMMKVRIYLLSSSAYTLGKALAITLRYSFMRKQFKNDRKEEVPVIQYQLQQYKLFPLLAKSFAMECSFRRVIKLVNQCNQEIVQNNFVNLQEVHILLSGAKSMYTWWCMNGLVSCMQCCGGHGFSHYSGIPALIQTFSPNTILEGENTMLTLQVGRYLLKCFRNIKEGKPEKVGGHCEYLKLGEVLALTDLNSNGQVKCPVLLKKLFQKCAYLQLGQIFELVIENSQHMSFTNVFNKKIGIKLLEVSRIHTILFTFEFFLDHVNTIKHEATHKSLMNLALLFAIDALIENTHIFAALNVVSSDQIGNAKFFLEELLDNIFNDSLVLAEAFVPDDYILFSAIADSNEKPYENLYNLAKKVGSMNQVDLSGFYLETIRKSSLASYPDPKL
jgi:acyl-CoA oxidase